jgi:hypothetical protein
MSNQQEEVRILPDNSYELARVVINNRAKLFIRQSLENQFGKNFLNPPTPIIAQPEQIAQPVTTPVPRAIEAIPVTPITDTTTHLDLNEIRSRISEEFDEAA